MEVKVSFGDAVDKYTILCIKSSHAKSESDKYYVQTELELLQRKMSECISNRESIRELEEELLCTNRTLWCLEDQVRLPNVDTLEIARLARIIFALNDRRAAIKKIINEITMSPLHEVKIRQSTATT